MHILSVSSAFSNPRQASEDLAKKLTDALPADDSPDFIALFGISELVQAEMKDHLQEKFVKTVVHASSSAKGVISADWSSETPPPACAAFAIFDPDGDYGTASANLSGNATKIAANTLRHALATAGREGEAPELVLLSCAPGHEEDVLDGLRQVVGHGTQILGATSADGEFSDRWAQFASTSSDKSSLVISVLFPTRRVMVSHDCGFEATPSNGQVTSVQKRLLQTIDNEPAAKVYARWLGLTLGLDKDGNYVHSPIDPSRSTPMGKVVGYEAGVPQLQLIQPREVLPDGSMTLMSEVREGDRLWCMSGGHAQLLSRIAPLIDLAMAGEDDAPRGGLIVLCATDELCNDREMQNLARRLKSCIGDLPSLAVFSYGEQWMRDTGDYAHANQMMLCAMFR